MALSIFIVVALFCVGGAALRARVYVRVCVCVYCCVFGCA